MNTNYLKQAEKFIKEHEGLRLKPYQDTVGKLTIGYGRNLDDVGITPPEAEAMLSQDIELTDKALQSFEWFAELNDVRKAVVVDMAFNLGMTKFMQFKKMLVALQQLDYQEAAHEMLDSKWAGQVGRRALTLAKAMERGYLT